MRVLRPGGHRLDPVTLDLVLAAILAIATELEAWFGSVGGLGGLLKEQSER